MPNTIYFKSHYIFINVFSQIKKSITYLILLSIVTVSVHTARFIITECCFLYNSLENVFHSKCYISSIKTYIININQKSITSFMPNIYFKISLYFCKCFFGQIIKSFKRLILLLFFIVSIHTARFIITECCFQYTSYENVFPFEILNLIDYITHPNN